MSHFMCAFKGFFVARKILVNINDVISLEILVKSSRIYKRSENQYDIHSMNNFKWIAGLELFNQTIR